MACLLLGAIIFLLVITFHYFLKVASVLLVPRYRDDILYGRVLIYNSKKTHHKYGVAASTVFLSDYSLGQYFHIQYWRIALSKTMIDLNELSFLILHKILSKANSIKIDS
ncbi:hypothetical protein ACJX0J_009683 [Zea mays]